MSFSAPSGSGSEWAPSAGLRRDVEILEVLSSTEGQHGLGVSRIAAQLGREKSQVSRALKALEAEGMVERDPRSREYRLGWRLYALAARTGEARLVRIAVPVMQQVTGRLDETSYLCVLRGSRVITLVTIAATHAWRGFGWEGVSVPAPMSAAGRALLSDWSPEVLRPWIARAIAAPDVPRRIVRSPESIAESVRQARERGYAVVDGEFEGGVASVAAPVHDYRGSVAAAITVSAPAATMRGRLNEVGTLLADAAADLSLAISSP